MEIRDVIRKNRIKKGISQEALAAHIDVSQSAYAKMEKGITSIKLDTFKLICAYLDICPISIISRAETGECIKKKIKKLERENIQLKKLVEK